MPRAAFRDSRPLQSTQTLCVPGSAPPCCAWSVCSAASCNTTPTQTRLTNLENRVAEHGSTIVPRAELTDRQHVVEQLQAQRDKRIDELERNYDRVADELMQRRR